MTERCSETTARSFEAVAREAIARKAGEEAAAVDYPVSNFVALYSRKEWEAMGNTWPGWDDDYEVADEDVIIFNYGTEMLTLIHGELAIRNAINAGILP